MRGFLHRPQAPFHTEMVNMMMISLVRLLTLTLMMAMTPYLLPQLMGVIMMMLNNAAIIDSKIRIINMIPEFNNSTASLHLFDFSPLCIFKSSS